MLQFVLQGWPTRVKQWARGDLRRGLKEFVEHDLRVTYLAIGGLVVVGIIVNLLLPRGWTVWPFVLGAAIMLGINEMADRSGQGIPPLRIYLLFTGAVIGWIAVVLIISAFNPIVLLVGISILGYYWAKGYIKTRERKKLIIARRVAGCCIHCGQVIDPQYAYCQNCGEDPDPETSLLKRITTAPRGLGSADKARKALKPESIAASAARKEQALMARRRTKRTRR